MKKIRKKIVMLGAFGVGKTSLVRRFVTNEFSEDYLSTVGVRVEKAIVNKGDIELELLIWDLAGHDEFAKLQVSYLRGASGAILVGDSTRAWTLQKAQEMKDELEGHLPGVPWQYVLSKTDLPPDLMLSDVMASTGFSADDLIQTSAKTGEAVLDAFDLLADKVLSSENGG